MLEVIIELNYYGQFKVVLFKCKWADTTRDRGYKKDQWNFNCVNFDRLIHTMNLIFWHLKHKWYII